MKTIHSIGKIKLALKNHRKSGGGVNPLATLGFSGNFYEIEKFREFLQKQTPKRRRAYMRLGRVALRQNDLVSLWQLMPRRNYYSSEWIMETDLRKIKFNKQLEIVRLENILKETQKKLGKIPKIIGVAIKHSRESEEFCFMSKPWRHHDLIREMVEKGFKPPISGQQGFLLDNGEFINRVDGLELALKNGQVKDVAGIRKPNLYSEDLW